MKNPRIADWIIAAVLIASAFFISKGCGQKDNGLPIYVARIDTVTIEKIVPQIVTVYPNVRLKSKQDTVWAVQVISADGKDTVTKIVERTVEAAKPIPVRNYSDTLRTDSTWLAYQIKARGEVLDFKASNGMNSDFLAGWCRENATPILLTGEMPRKKHRFVQAAYGMQANQDYFLALRYGWRNVHGGVIYSPPTGRFGWEAGFYFNF